MHFNIGFAAVGSQAFARIDGFTVNFKTDHEKWRGNQLYVEAVGEKAIDVTGKIDTIDVYGGALALAAGVTPVAGSVIPVPNEVKLGVVGAAYTLANANVNEVYWARNLSDGVDLTKVTSNPAAGEYTLDPTTGAVVFHSSMTGKNVQFGYSYKASGVGKTVTGAQRPGALVTGVRLVGFAGSNAGKPCGLQVFNAFLDGVDLTMKAGAFTQKNISWFGAKDQTTGLVYDAWTGE